MTLPPEQYRQMERHVPELEAVEPPRIKPRSLLLWIAAGFVSWLVLLALGWGLVHALAALQDAATPSSGPSAAHPASAQSGVPHLAAAGESMSDDSGGAPQTLDPRVGREGDIAHSGSRSHYVAIPLGPGIRIRVCGPADCIETTSTDAGPNRAMLLAGRIMDLDIGKFERVCGMPARYGLCPGSWMRVTGPRVTLPPTDSEGGNP